MPEAGKPIAIIPARGGSKRIPGKNLRPFFGHPMMAYGISAAVNSGLFEKVVVSSDDAEIGRVAQWYGAEFIERPVELATDTAKSIDAVTHVLRVLNERGIHPDSLCQVFPNCPLVTSADVIEHGRLFSEHGRKFQISVVTYRCVYPEWAMVKDAEGRGQWAMGKEFLGRSQDCARAYCPTGAVWWARCEDLIAQNTFYGSPFHLAEMDANRGVDIDDEEDLRLSELLVLGLEARDGRSPLEMPAMKSYFREEPSCSRK
ncbi:MAG TPA: acylneuraminate cytidylyltransferase family protein [Candidatus Aquilonibacter sp.]|nr:acylneuraminate cytidylyltransferase family protein [Candidatus Aquilonibacter sp.]